MNIVYFQLIGLYTNALLGSLNARDWFRTNKNPISIPLRPLGPGATHSHRPGISLAYRDTVSV